MSNCISSNKHSYSLLSAKLILSITDNLLDKVIIIALTIFIIEFARNLFHYINNYFVEKLFYTSLNKIQLDICNEAIKLETSEIDKNSSGVFIDRLTKDAEDIGSSFNSVMHFCLQFVQEVGFLVTILVINWQMFIFTIIMIAISTTISHYQTKSWFNAHKEIKKMNEKNSGLISELVRGMRDIKVLNAGSNFIGGMIEKIETANKKSFKIERNQDAFRLGNGTFKDLFVFLFMVFGVYLVRIGQLTIDNFVVLYTYRGRADGLSLTISYFLENSKSFTLATTRVFELIDNTFEKEKFGTKHLNKVEGNFKFENVNFSYNNKVPILKNLSFEIKPNETVAFVGRSGGGKSTIFSLIDKLYTVQDGKITIDGVDINKLDKDSIRDNISIITQSPYIFNLSIKDNLKIAKPDATDEEIKEVCKIAIIDKFIESQPDKYDTIVGEGGLNLSGGQRQRIAIARALLKKTEIILFDEATSALDNESQEYIKKTIDNLVKDHTIIIVAHRLSTIVDADIINVIDMGKLESSGTHKQLLKESKVYNSLYTNESLN